MVSIVIPVYNVAPFIERCARSLFAQTYPDIEFIFVDDASPDNSIEILQRVITDFPARKNQIRVLHNSQNKGLAATRFVGIDTANGDYILNVDSDDWIEPTMVEEMIEAAINFDADMVCCEAILHLKDNEIAYNYPYDEETQECGLLRLYVSNHYAAIWNKLIRKSLFAKHNIRYYAGIDFGEDTALTYRLRYFSKKTIIVHKKFYHYNQANSDSMMTSQCYENQALQRINLVDKMHNFFDRRNELHRYEHVLNAYKFIAKEYYLRIEKNLRKWQKLFPESHKDIFLYRDYTFTGKLKWWLATKL